MVRFSSSTSALSPPLPKINPDLIFPPAKNGESLRRSIHRVRTNLNKCFTKRSVSDNLLRQPFRLQSEKRTFECILLFPGIEKILDEAKAEAEAKEAIESHGPISVFNRVGGDPHHEITGDNSSQAFAKAMEKGGTEHFSSQPIC